MSKYEHLLMHETYRSLFSDPNNDLPDDDSNLDSDSLPDDDLEDDEDSLPDDDTDSDS